jgi:hypothetical protein
MTAIKQSRTVKHTTEPHLITLSVCVDGQVAACLRQIARQEERSLSQVARRLFRQALGLDSSDESNARAPHS